MLKIDAKRHVAKTISWRIIGTLDTILLSWIISGDPMVGLSIGLFEVITKMTLYYFHERAWYRIKFGIQRPRKSTQSINWDPNINNNNAGKQVAFIQDETNDFIKRLKVIKHDWAYTVILSSYNKNTSERIKELKYYLSKQNIESTYNIKIKD